MKRFIAIAIGFGFLVAGGRSLQGAQGVSTSFVDVVVLDVPLGQPRTIEDNGGRGLVIHNNSDEAVDVHVEILVPRPDQLRDHSRPIPDAQWIKVNPADFHLPAHESLSAEVTLHVPVERRHRGRFYQAMVWTRARPVTKKGVTVSMGLLSRLRFKVKAR